MLAVGNQMGSSETLKRLPRGLHPITLLYFAEENHLGLMWRVFIDVR
jgi:hypothetical protein